MSEFIRLQANGVDAFPDASTQNTYRDDGTSVESSLVSLEGQITTIGGVAGDAKTMAEQNSEKIATVEQKISDIDSSLENKIVLQDYSIPCTQGSNPYYGEVLIEKDGYTPFSVCIKTPIMGVDHMQSCGIRNDYNMAYGQCVVAGTMKVEVAYIKN